MARNVRVEAKRLPPGANKADRDKALQQLIRIFKRACNEYGVSHSLKEHEFFIRPTDKKRRKRMMKVRGALEAELNKNKSNEEGKNNG